MLKRLVALVILLSSYSCIMSQDKEINKEVVENLDIDKYLGTWYEIARYDHRFERGLSGVTATYSYRDDGKIKVVNRGYKGGLDGKLSEAIGKAKVPDPEIASKLKVSFFWIFYGDYFVIELEPNYKWAVVGSSSDKYLWILSRSKKLEVDVMNDILSRLKNRNYDTSKLIIVEQ